MIYIEKREREKKKFLDDIFMMMKRGEQEHIVKQ